MQFIRKI